MSVLRSKEKGTRNRQEINMLRSYQKRVFMAVIGFFMAALFFGVARSESQERGSTPSTDSHTPRQEKKSLFDFSRTDFGSSFSGTIGYRSDDLSWNIAGDTTGNNPNILSELEWEDLGIFQIKGSNVTVFRGVYLKGSFAYGWIFSGDVQDSDYLADNRGLEFSRSNNSADDGNTLDASIGIGYQFLFGSGFVGISPMIGYSYHEQNLTMTDGNQTVTSILAPPLGGFEDLDSSYDTEWKGPWLGVDIAFTSPSFDESEAEDRYELILGFEYNWADYEAEADWNLRTDFAHPKSFEQDADGYGIVISGEFNFFFNRHWALNFNGYYQTWESDSGLDRTFLADGTVLETRLNKVDWNSYALMLGVVYTFQ